MNFIGTILNRVTMYQSMLFFLIIILGALFLLQRILLSLPFSFELSLLFGNIFARAVSPDFRQSLVLRRKEILAPSIVNFCFESIRRFAFTPGQFLEYTLSHSHADSRGIRRFFTIASSPSEKLILLTTRFSEKGSTFKRALSEMRLGEEIIASRVSGEFVLPRDANTKLVFIAGGIGIIPFRSIVKYMRDTNQSRDIILLYGAKIEADLVFRNMFDEAEKRFGMKNIYMLSDAAAPSGWKGRKGFIDETLIKEEVPDFLERTFYVSGPEPMVRNMEKTLSAMGIARAKIKRDYFPGYEE